MVLWDQDEHHDQEDQVVEDEGDTHGVLEVQLEEILKGHQEVVGLLDLEEDSHQGIQLVKEVPLVETEPWNQVAYRWECQVCLLLCV